jgi:signal transduction histidine kinase
MVPVILEQVSVLFNAPAAAFAVIDAHSGEAVVELGRGDFAAGSGARVPALRAQLTHILAQGQPYLTTGADERVVGWMGETRPTYAFLGVPLVANNRGIGVLWVGSDGPITPQTEALLVAIADISANALYRAALYDEMERYATDLEVRVAERTRELENANNQLLTLDRLKSKFVSNVSHELRTPISNLKLYMSLLQRGKPEKRPHYTDMLHLSVERLGQLVEDILNLSRLEIAHYQPRELASTDLNALVGQIVTLHQPQADAAGLLLAFVPDTSLPLIDGDYNQLSQLVTNLLVNSLHYTRQGSVEVATRCLPDEGQVLFSIRDTGVGILPEDVPHVFERFYRGNHRQAEDIPGTGLGLAIVREIVDIHHGDITISSRVDAGTAIEVTLPIAQGGTTWTPRDPAPVIHLAGKHAAETGG